MLEMMTPLETNEHDVLKICSQIDSSKSSAIDNLSTRVIKDSFICLYKQLTHLINLSFKTGNIPKAWKYAKITPLQNNGDPNQVTNLRPIALLPLPVKIIERIAHTQITAYLESHHLLNPDQGGFRPYRILPMEYGPPRKNGPPLHSYPNFAAYYPNFVAYYVHCLSKLETL